MERNGNTRLKIKKPTQKVGFFYTKYFYTFAYMSVSINRSLGIQKNKLLRYKLIKELYEKHKTEDIPTTVVWRKYVCPIYPISRTTLYEVLTTPVTSKLREINELIDAQTKLFD